MNTTAIRSALAALSFLVLTRDFAGAQPIQRLEPQEAHARPIVLTVEGGGTLGTYEGGLTWALTEIFRRRRLLEKESRVLSSSNPRSPVDDAIQALQLFEFRAAAGASAGSINAFLAANRWCSKEPPERAQDSPFWRAWVQTGLSDMMPPEEATPGVFSRNSYAKIFADFELNWRGSKYDASCPRVTFGAAMTRLSQDSLPISQGREVYARNQRYAAAFIVTAPKVDSGLPIYTTFARDTTPIRLGAVVELVTHPPTDTIAHQAAYDLIEASSGFPFAFEPYRVAYCQKSLPANTSPAKSVGCRRGMARSTAYFVDGGVFDNGPLSLGYGIALADTTRPSLDSLAMLFVTPSRRRGTKRLPSDSSDARTDGLDAVVKLLQTFVPSARQYELQIAARLLPALQAEDYRSDRAGATIRTLREAMRLEAIRSGDEHDSLTKYWREAQTDIWTLELANGELRNSLQRCRVDPSVCASFPDGDSVLADAQRRLDEKWSLGPPPPASVDPAQTPAVPTRTPFDSLLYVTSRWHTLAGDWLFGFGGFLGRPFREYDFYVGVYDALVLVAERIKCARVDSPTCVADSLFALIARPPVLIDESEQRLLLRLYVKEHGPTTVSGLSTPRDISPKERLLSAIIDVMPGRSNQTRQKCKDGGPIERLVCSEGMKDVFTQLRANSDFRATIDKPEAFCDAKEKHCEIDDWFIRFVMSPAVALNYLAGEILNRMWSTTPDTSSFKGPLTLANAIYFSTNERARSGRDFGSVSLPTRRTNATSGLWILPSSLGGFTKMQGWYAEWTLRFHINSDYAVGPVGRIVWASTVRTPKPYGPHFVPSLRFERKAGGSHSPLLSTFGVDLAYWSDGGKWTGGGRFSPGLTSALLAQKVRVLWALRPRPGKRSQMFFSIGLGDIPGLFYWIGEYFDEKSKNAELYPQHR